MATPEQRPLELILARNLITSLTTPAMLVNRPGDVVFYNDAAGGLLGRTFEETGTRPAEEWVAEHGPFDEDGQPIPIERQALTIALRANRAGHAKQRIRTAQGAELDIEVSGVPIIGNEGFKGAIVFFWRAREVDE
jgi:PAS domain-containing protein